MTALTPQHTKPARSRATVVTPDPRVWALALEIAKGDASRLEVVSASEVVVRNRPVRRTRRGATI